MMSAGLTASWDMLSVSPPVHVARFIGCEQTRGVGMLTAETGPCTGSYSGLHVPEPRGRHVFNEVIDRMCK